MTLRAKPVIATLAGAMMACPLWAQDASVSMGRDIAEEYCSACHDVGPGGPFKLDPPSFAAIARFRSEDQIRDRIIRPIHNDMPRYTDYMIGNNIEDMVAYILSLEE